VLSSVDESYLELIELVELEGVSTVWEFLEREAHYGV
jgi:hypothetical protein